MTVTPDAPRPDLDLELTADQARARDYIGVFVAADTRWRDFVPVDSTVHGETVRIGSVLLERNEKGQWGMDLGTEYVWFGRAGGSR